MYTQIEAGGFLPEWVKNRLLMPFKYELGSIAWFENSILNDGVLCRVKHGNEWINTPVLISGVFICRNRFSYIARTDDIRASGFTLSGSNHFSDAIPL